MRTMQHHLFEYDMADLESGSFLELCRAFHVEPIPGWPDYFGLAMRQWFASIGARPLRTLSLFSGAGGLDIGFHDAGFQIQTSVEIDKRFAATLSANTEAGGYLAGTEVVCRDVRLFHPTDEGEIDLILGGPPCQSFSAAGRRAAGVQGTQDARGTLFQEYIRILLALKPVAFVFENVYGITGAEKGKAWKEIKNGFEQAGYNISFRILDAADYGVPQHRERMFIVGTREGRFRFPAPTHGTDSPDQLAHYTAELAVTGALVGEKERYATVNGKFGHLLSEIPLGLNYSFFTEKMNHPEPIFAWRSKFSDFLYKADPKLPIRTLKAQGGQYTGPFHWDSRPFSLGELKRLQTFPDAYQIIGGRQVAIHQIGNSVPPQLARILALAILQEVFKVNLPCRLPLLNEGEVLSFRSKKRERTSVYLAKAKVAIGDRVETRSAGLRPTLREEHAGLSPEFGWIQPSKSGTLLVKTSLNHSSWEIFVERSLEPSNAKAFQIDIAASADHDWALRDTDVTLAGDTLAMETYVAAWKAFESELSRQRIKADLVQLCEYYQYRPRFTCSMSIFGLSEKKWEIVSRVVSGIGVREILTSQKISRLWECKEDEVYEYMNWLKSLAYEVRNSVTNPQIPSGCFLIPYCFPTLNPLSVQLRKSLASL